MARLSEKQRRFVEAYMGEAAGNATQAARLAGYKGNATTLASVGAENLRKPAIAEAIQERVDGDPLVADRQECQRWYTQVMRGDTEATREQLKAAELLGKTQGHFIDRSEVTHMGAQLDVQIVATEDEVRRWAKGG